MSSFTFSATTLPFQSCNSSRFPTQKHVIRRRGNILKCCNEEMENVDEIASGSPSTSFLTFLCPLLKLFSGGDPSSKRNYLLEEATSTLSTLARLPWGSRAQYGRLDSKDGAKVNPPMHLQIFEFVGKYEVVEVPWCGFAVSGAGDVSSHFGAVTSKIQIVPHHFLIYPCPKGSVRHREMVRRLGGKEQFPFLVDPNTGTSLYESGDIVKYLFHQYGQGRNPSTFLLESTILTGWMPTLLRSGRGMTFWERSRKEPPPKKLELFSYENNPYARIVREALCELELPYILNNIGEGSTREQLLINISGGKEVPYLVDPNTGTQIGDYKKIIQYLFQTYSSDAL